MNPDLFTVPQITSIHLLFELIAQQDGVVRPVLEKIGVTPQVLQAALAVELGSLPRGEGGQIGIDPKLDRILNEGETVTLRLPTRDGEVRTATIIKVYPELRDGAVVADATVQGGLEALVGERVDVLAPVGERRAMLVPADFVSTRYGVDFIRVKVGDRFVDAPVALSAPLPNDAGQYEVLSGLKSGDHIEKPE